MNREEFYKLMDLPTELSRVDQVTEEDIARGYKLMRVTDSNGLSSLERLPLTKANLYGGTLSGPGSAVPYAHVVFGTQTRYLSVPMHRQRYMEMFYIYEGTCTATVNGSRMKLRAGDVVLTDAMSTCVIDSLRSGTRVLNCLFGISFFNSQFLERLESSGPLARLVAGMLRSQLARDRHLLFRIGDDEPLRQTFEYAYAEHLKPGLCAVEMLDSYMMLIFVQLARWYQNTKDEAYRVGGRICLSDVLLYVEAHYADCTLEATAEKFGFHPNYLSRALKRVTGLAFKDLVDQARLRQAIYLLQNSTLAINEIATECGWSNLGQFYKKFSTEFGCLPREYRAQHAALSHP